METYHTLTFFPRTLVLKSTFEEKIKRVTWKMQQTVWMFPLRIVVSFELNPSMFICDLFQICGTCSCDRKCRFSKIYLVSFVQNINETMNERHVFLQRRFTLFDKSVGGFGTNHKPCWRRRLDLQTRTATCRLAESFVSQTETRTNRCDKCTQVQTRKGIDVSLQFRVDVTSERTCTSHRTCFEYFPRIYRKRKNKCRVIASFMPYDDSIVLFRHFLK